MKFVSLSTNVCLGGMQRVSADLREALKGHGIQVEWLTAGRRFASAMEAPDNPSELAYGHWVGRDAESDRDVGRALHDFIVQGGYAGVFLNVLGGPVEANLARYLPPAIFRIMIVHSITRGTYRQARAVRDHVHLAVGVSPRIRRDLVERLHFPPEGTVAVFNAIDIARYAAVTPQRRAPTQPLRLISLGRLEERSKQLSLLPKILGRLPAGSATLTVAGDGPDRRPLERALAPYGAQVTFLGPVPPSQVPRVFSEHDVFVMPSRYEGFGLAILEAMAAGAVPLVTRIAGVTDAIITHGENGVLFPLGDAPEAARQIMMLHDSREHLDRLSEAARRRACDECFSLPFFGAQYNAAIRCRLSRPRPIAPVLPVERWEMHPKLRERLWIPQRLRPFLAHWYYRIRR